MRFASSREGIGSHAGPETESGGGGSISHITEQAADQQIGNARGTRGALGLDRSVIVRISTDPRNCIRTVGKTAAGAYATADFDMIPLMVRSLELTRPTDRR